MHSSITAFHVLLYMANLQDKGNSTRNQLVTDMHKYGFSLSGCYGKWIILH